MNKPPQSSILRSGLVGQSHTKASLFFERIIPDFLTEPYSSASTYAGTVWNKLLAGPKNELTNSLRGGLFELLVGTVLVRENLLPFFRSASVQFVPNVKFDFLLYEEGKGPICMSCKTSLRERYKQADLEAIALKSVHRSARSILLTMEINEAKTQNKKIARNDITGLNQIIVCNSAAFDSFVLSLKECKFTDPGMVQVVKGMLIKSSSS